MSAVNGPIAAWPAPWFCESLSEYQTRVRAKTPAELEGAAETWRQGLDATWREWKRADVERDARAFAIMHPSFVKSIGDAILDATVEP